MEEYVKLKSLEIISKLLQTNIFNPNDITITQLSGISNRTYKCHLNIEEPTCLERLKQLEKGKIKKKMENSDPEESGLLHIDTPITTIIYKHFGKISVIVDRKLECMIIEKLSSLNKGPKILETDNITYRVEEFITNSRNIKHSELFSKEYLSQLTEIFHIFTSMSNYPKYSKYLNFSNKQLIAEDLLNDKDNESNLYNFAAKMLKYANAAIDDFEKEVFKDKAYWENLNIENSESQINFDKN